MCAMKLAVVSVLIGLGLGCKVHGQWAVPPLTERAREFGHEARQLWVDASANWSLLLSEASIRDICARASRAGFNEIILDVKPIVGRVLFPSQVATELREWKGIRKPDGLDILGTMVKAARAEGLRICASINVFSEGHAHFERAGDIWQHPDWASTAVVWEWTAERGGARVACGRANTLRPGATAAVFTPDGWSALQKLPEPEQWLAVSEKGVVTASGSGRPPRGEWKWLLVGFSGGALQPLVEQSGPIGFRASALLEPVTEHASSYTALFVSPLHPEARARQIALAKEIAERYEVDGLVMDRMRFEGWSNDFGPSMREVFVRRFGEPASWPEDVLAPPKAPGEVPEKGPRWSEYQQLRAEVIRDFLGEVRDVLPKTISLGAYVGAWYDRYEGVGVNWADDALPVQYGDAERAFRFSGYANMMDFLCVGAYYRPAEAEDLPDDPLLTVAGSTARAVEVAGDATFVYSTLYLLEYKDAEELRAAIRAARRNSLGVCVFDLVYVMQNDWWHVFEEEFALAPGPPHANPSLLRSLRDAR